MTKKERPSPTAEHLDAAERRAAWWEERAVTAAAQERDTVVAWLRRKGEDRLAADVELGDHEIAAEAGVLMQAITVPEAQIVADVNNFNLADVRYGIWHKQPILSTKGGTGQPESWAAAWPVKP